MQKIKLEVPFKARPENIKYFQWLMGMDPEERKAYLNKRILEADSETVYFCKHCKDAGFIYHPTHEKEDIMFGKSILCPECRGKGQAIKHTSSSVKNTWEQTFEHWHNTKGTEESFKLAKEWATGQANWLWLLIYGEHGCGKTHLARASQATLRKRACEVAYIYAVDLFDDLRRSLDTKTLEERVSYYKDIMYLIIDDFGAQKITDWTTEKFEQILNWRYDNYQPTMMTMNGNPDSLPPAIYSRFRDAERSRMSLNKSGDYRPKKT